MNYIIIFKEESDPSLITSLGGTVIKNLSAIRRMLVAELPESAYLELVNHPKIFHIKEDEEIPVENMLPGEEKDVLHGNYKPKPTTFAWHLQAVRAYDYWERGITGKGVKVAVFDGGIGKHHQLPNLKGGVDVSDFNATPDPFRDDRSSGFAHGTQCASVIGGQLIQGGAGATGGVAPDVELYAIKYLGYTIYRESRKAEAINWAIENEMDIISMSVGLSGYPIADWELYQSAIDAGIIIVASAGNSDTAIADYAYPAYHDNVITVTGMNTDYKRWSYCYGKQVDFIAPCRQVETMPHTTNGVLGTTLGTSGNGTSFSCPVVAGVFALYKQAFPNKTNQELYEMVKNSARKLEGQTGWDQYRGWGLPQPSKEILAMPKVAKRRGFRFFGNGDYIDCGNATNLNIKDNITLIAKVTQDYRNHGHVFAKVNSTGGNTYYSMLLGSDGLYPEYRSLNSQYKPKYQYSVAHNRESVVAFVYDYPAKTITIYIDGKPAQSTIAMVGTVMDLSAAADKLLIGSMTSSSGNFINGSFAGILHTAKVYNRSLSASEILQDYNGELLTSGLQLYYDFTGLETTSVPDLSGNNNVGTIVGARQAVVSANGRNQTSLASAPLNVTNLTATPTDHGVTLSWTASLSAGVKYEVWQNGKDRPITTVSTNTYAVTLLDDSTNYTFKVVTVDSFGNASAGVSITTTTSTDITGPNAITGLLAAAYTDTTATLTWVGSSSTDDVTHEVSYGLTGSTYATSILLDADVKATGYHVTSLTPNTFYNFWVVSKDRAGNKSTAATISKTTAASETIIYQESFDRPDDTLLNGLVTEVGNGTITVVPGYDASVADYRITGGKAYNTSADIKTWTTLPTLPMATNKFAFEIHLSPSWPPPNFLFRMVNNYENSMYLGKGDGEADGSNSKWVIYKIVGGTFTKLGTSLEVASTDSHIRIENHSDGTVNVIDNGKLVLSIKDSTHLATSNMLGFSAGKSGMFFDNLKIVALA